MAMDEFMAWSAKEPRYGFSEATGTAWEARWKSEKLGSSSIIVRMSAI
jgi:hypothetical protein